MIFSSIFFIFIFLPITMIAYYIAPNPCKNLLLLLVSLLFYAWGEPVYVILMILSILFNYVSGLIIDQSDNRRFPLFLSIGINVGMLIFFKYTKLLSLPIGISFYTFQALSYLVDLYRGKVKVQKNIISFGLYIALFPQLIAGPIVKYEDIAAQLSHRIHSIQKIGNGAIFFIVGLAKKVLLANYTGLLYQTLLAMPASKQSVLGTWLAYIAYTFQIYFDFSGYSDMAVGLGQMFGFQFCMNFNYPYISDSITEFWRRWHLSLSTWFKDYVYIPLGGNRKDTPTTIRNLLLVWVLTGLWHGSGWCFLTWGLYYGLLLVLEKFVLHDCIAHLPAFVRHLYTLLAILIGWVFFTASTVGNAFTTIQTMFGLHGINFCNSTFVYYFYTNILLLIIAAIGCTPLVHTLFYNHVFHTKEHFYRMAGIVYLLLFVLCISYLVTQTYNPFLYFRF